MKIVLKIILILVFAAIGAFAVSFTSKVKTEAATASVSAVSGARELYVRNCAKCHGTDGKGQTKDGLRLDVPDLTELKPSKSKIVKAITNGADGMPAFGSKLKKNEINLVANYVRSL